MVQIASFWEIPVGTRLQNMYDVVKVDTMVSQYLQYAGSDTVKSTPPPEIQCSALDHYPTTYKKTGEWKL